MGVIGSSVKTGRFFLVDKAEFCDFQAKRQYAKADPKICY
jgi:hypothetical protein